MSKPADRPSRRAFFTLVPGAALGLAGCATTPPPRQAFTGPIYRVVSYDSREKPGTIVVDPPNHVLYLVQKGGQSLQYDVGVGKEGYGWAGGRTAPPPHET